MIAISKSANTAYKLLCIDPGCRTDGGTGVALLNSPNDIKTYLLKPIVSYKDAWEIKIEEVCVNYHSLLRILIENNIVVRGYTKVVIEKPKFFNTYKGARAANSDSLFKLIVCYARIWQISIMQQLEIRNIEIIHWKGQLSKTQVKHRVETDTNKTFEGDCIDAVGIGLYCLRKGLPK